MSENGADAALEDIAGELPQKKLSGKTLVLFIMLPLVMLVSGGAGLYISGVLDVLLRSEASSKEEKALDLSQPGFFYDLPDIIVNLNTAERRQIFLKLSPTLELSHQEDIEQIERVLPRIMDNFQIYLRELTIDDLRGSAGMHRLREELLRRVNGASHPVQVREVLFREMLLS